MAGNGTPGGALKDEQGQPSMARRLLTVWTLVLVWVTWTDVRFGVVPNQVWVALVPVYLALVGWAVGPRVFQYIGPKAAEVASAIGKARADKTDRMRTDDER